MKIAIYARQSLDQKDSISIDTQIDFCKKEIADGSEYTVYQDKGFSGKNIDRPSFTKLLEDIENKKISKVIVYRLDRISRSITDFANIIDILEENKVDFISANEKFDTSAPVGRAMLYIIMVFAQLERETIAERIKDNYYARGKTGVWLGGPAPIGYDIKKSTLNGKRVSTLAPNPDIELVKKIYARYASSSISLGGLAKEIKAELGQMWDNVKLSRILHNPAYVKADADIYTYYKAKKCVIINDIEEFNGVKGCNLYGKRDRGANKYNLTSEHVLTLSMHTGVIDSQTWLRCQAKLDNNRQIKNTGKGKHTWLTGLVKCGYCGYSLNVKLFKENKYLNCTGRYVTDLCKEKLATHYVEDIEKAALDAIIKYTNELKITGVKNDDKGNDYETNKLKIELSKTEDQIENLINGISSANGVLFEYINKKIIELDSRKNELLQMINSRIAKHFPIDIPDMSNWASLDLEARRDIANNLITKISVYDDTIEVSWKF